MGRPETLTGEEELLDALHSLLWLRYKHWPLAKDDLQSPFERNCIAPILPRVEAWDRVLNGDDAPEMRQVTEAERQELRDYWRKTHPSSWRNLWGRI